MHRSCFNCFYHTVNRAISHIRREHKMITMFKAYVFLLCSQLIVDVFLILERNERVILSYYHTYWDTVNLS